MNNMKARTLEGKVYKEVTPEFLLEIYGVRPHEIMTENMFNDTFECVMTGYEDIYISKATYSHDDEGLVFKYKYALVVTNLNESGMELEDEGYGYVISLNLVPMVESLNSKLKADYLAEVASSEKQATVEDVPMSYLVSDGVDITMLSNSSYGFTEDILPYVLHYLATCVTPVDSLRGFYLDQPYNRIGDTKWARLSELING